MPLSYEAERSVKLMATCEAKQKWIRNEAHFLINVSFEISNFMSLQLLMCSYSHILVCPELDVFLEDAAKLLGSVLG